MTVATGCGGSVGGESQIREWTVNWQNSPATYNASNTGCAMSRLPGVADWSGSYNFFGVEPALVPGESFTFQGYDSTHLLSGPAICQSLSINIDIEGGGIISGSVAFAADGALAASKASSPDKGAVSVYSSIGCKITVDGTEVSDARTGTFTVTRNNPSYSSSSTAGQTKRLSGVLDASGSYTIFQSDFTALPEEGDVIEVVYYVNATDAWTFSKVIVTSVTPAVQIETAAVVGATVNWAWTAFWPDGTQGSIQTPSGAFIFGS